MFSPIRLFILVAVIASLPSAAIADENGEAARTDLYGDPLPPGAIARLGSARFQLLEPYSIEALAFSPDSKIVASAGYSGVVLWDRATGKKLRAFPIEGFPLLAVHFDTDGKVQVLGTHYRNSPHILHPESRKKTVQMALGEEYHWRDVFTFSADGKRLLGACRKEMAVWDTATGKKLVTLREDQAEIAALALAPDYGKAACVLAKGRSIEVVNPRTGERCYQLEAAPDQRFTGVVFSRDGKHLFSAATDGIRVCDANTGKAVRRLNEDNYSMQALAISADGKTLATSPLYPPDVTFWDAATGKRMLPPSVERHSIETLAYTDPKTLVTINRNGVACFWDVESGKCRRRVGEKQGFDRVRAVSPNGELLAGWTMMGLFGVWDVAAGKWRWQHNIPFTGFFPLEFSPDGKMLIGTGLKDPQPRDVCLDTTTGALSYPIPGESHDWLSLSSDGTTAALKRIKKIQLFRIRPHGPWSRLGSPVLLNNRSFRQLSPDGRTLLVMDNAGYLGLFEAASGGRFGWFTAPANEAESEIQGAAFSPKGSLLATAHLDGTVRLWDSATQRELERFAGASHRGKHLAISPDGRTLASEGFGRTVLVWQRRAFTRHKGRKPLSLGELENSWRKLAELDAEAGQRAVQALAASPEESVPFLDKHLPSIPRGDARRLRQWITDLESDSYAVRQKAHQELERQGEQAEDALEEVLANKPSLELRRRVLELLEKQENARRERSPDNLRAIRAVQVLEVIGTPEARRVLTKLSAGASGALRTQEARTALRRRPTPLAQSP